MAFLTDDFNRANAANRGANWTSVSGFSARIDTNEAEANNAGDPALEYYNAITPAGDAQYAEITLRSPIETGTDAGVGPAVRIQTGADSAYIVKVNTVAGQRFRVFKRVAGADGSALITYTGAAPAVGDRVGVSIDAAHLITLFVNDVSVGTFDASSSPLTGGRVGDFSLLVIDFPRWDDWEGGDLAATAFNGRWQLEDGSGNWQLEDASGYWVGEAFVASGYQDGAVSYAGVGNTAIAGQRVAQGAVTYAGAGATGFAGVRLAVGAVGYAGAGTYATAGVRLANGAVAYAGVGTFSTGAALNLTASVAYAGAGNYAQAGVRVATGAVAYNGVGTYSTAAVLKVAGAVAYQGTGTFLVNGQTSAFTDAAVTFAGVGAFAITPGLKVSAAVAYAGAGTTALAARRVTTATVAYQGTGSLSLSPALTISTLVAFSGLATFTVDGVAAGPNVDLLLTGFDASSPRYAGFDRSALTAVGADVSTPLLTGLGVDSETTVGLNHIHPKYVGSDRSRSRYRGTR